MSKEVLEQSFFRIAGVPVYESVHAVIRKQVRFPRTKKKRMQRKWAKQGKNFSETPAMFEMRLAGEKRRGIIAHPVLVAQLRRGVEQQRREEEKREWLYR